MKIKKGYTLSEILIALGIVGIIAAVGAPMINNAKPDKTKVMFLKAYDSLVDNVSDLVNTSTLYSPMYSILDNEGNESSIYDVQRYPLLDYALPLNAEYRSDRFSGPNKFCNMMLESFNSTMVNACGTGSSSSNFEDVYNFTTQPGNMWWRIEASDEDLTAGNNSGTVRYVNKVTVDVNGESAPNSTDGTVKRPPDRYIFYVFADGSVIPQGRFAQAFIANRLSLQKNKINLIDPATGIEFVDREDLTDTSVFPDYSITYGTNDNVKIKKLK